MDNTEFIKLGKDRPETEMRLLQKIEFGKVIIPFEFFTENKIPQTDIEILSVYQFDPNTRFTIIEDNLLRISNEHSIYNYIDKDRKVLVYRKYNYIDHNQEPNLYIFNDLDICERDLNLFNDFDTIRDLTLKKIGILNGLTCYLVFKEDIKVVKERIKEQREEDKLEKEREKADKINDELKRKELESKLLTINKDTKLEDKNIIIYKNYLIDKVQGIKIEFKKPIVDIIEKKYILHSYRDSNEEFISLDYREIIEKIEKIFETGKYEEPIEQKYKEVIKTNEKYLLDFKIYSYNNETKEEKFINSFKIDTDKGKTGKEHFLINKIQIPKQKIKFLLRFLRGRGSHYWHRTDNENTIGKYLKLEQNIENFKYYSGTQLDLLQGKEFKVTYKDRKISLNFEIDNPDKDKDNWQVKFGNLTLNKTYTEVKEIYNHSSYRSEHIAGQISGICECLKCEQLEDEIIKYLNVVLEKIRQAELKAKTLFIDFIEKNNTRIILKDNFYLIKGKLKTYKLCVEKSQVKVYTYPNEHYVCINEDSKEGHNLCIWDKLLQFAMALLNDSKIREEINTLN